MAGAGYKLFATGDVLSASEVNTYLMQQTVMSFASSAARTTALASVLAEGMVTYLQDTNVVEIYTGAAWVSLDDPNAIQNAIVDAKGDIIAATANDTPARLAVGANDTVLTADSTAATGLKWATPASSGGMTLLASGSISGASVDLTSISGSYTDLVVQYSGVNWATADDYLIMRFNGNTGFDYSTFLQATKLNVSLFYGAIDTARILIYPLQSWLRTGSNMFTFTIPDYASTLSRHLMYGTVEGTPVDGTGYKVLGTFAGATYSSTAISRITLSTQNGYTFNGGTYKLWGVK